MKYTIQQFYSIHPVFWPGALQHYISPVIYYILYDRRDTGEKPL